MKNGVQLNCPRNESLLSIYLTSLIYTEIWTQYISSLQHISTLLERYRQGVLTSVKVVSFEFVCHVGHSHSLTQAPWWWHSRSAKTFRGLCIYCVRISLHV